MSEAPVFYHGTRTPFRRGGLVVPGVEVGKENHGLGRSDRVYITRTIGLAQVYAEVATGRGRPRVVEVRPLGPVEVDDSTVMGAEQDAWSCESAVVVAVLPPWL